MANTMKPPNEFADTLNPASSANHVAIEDLRNTSKHPASPAFVPSTFSITSDHCANSSFPAQPTGSGTSAVAKRKRSLNGLEYSSFEERSVDSSSASGGSTSATLIQSTERHSISLVDVPSSPDLRHVPVNSSSSTIPEAIIPQAPSIMQGFPDGDTEPDASILPEVLSIGRPVASELREHQYDTTCVDYGLVEDWPTKSETKHLTDAAIQFLNKCACVINCTLRQRLKFCTKVSSTMG
jgi:hypothetical protein